MSQTAHGRFCSYDPMSQDPAGSRAFSTELLGRRTETSDMEVDGCAMTYRLLFQGDQRHGGILDLPAEAQKAGARPWTFPRRVGSGSFGIRRGGCWRCSRMPDDSGGLNQAGELL